MKSWKMEYGRRGWVLRTLRDFEARTRLALGSLHIVRLQGASPWVRLSTFSKRSRASTRQGPTGVQRTWNVHRILEGECPPVNPRSFDDSESRCRERPNITEICLSDRKKGNIYVHSKCEKFLLSHVLFYLFFVFSNFFMLFLTCFEMAEKTRILESKYLTQYHNKQ